MSTFRNILAVIFGAVAGAVLNGSIISFSSKIISPPIGANLTTDAGLIAAMPLMQPKHFIMPFLAHAIGTLVGAIITILVATNYKLRLAYLISFIFLIGGIMMVRMLHSPMWFNILDLGFAYIPMSYLAVKIIIKE